jgi:flavodoxin
MKYSVVFFTRTNTSKRVAEKISNKLSCELIQITDNINWKGILGFFKAGYYSSIDKHVDIQVHGNLDAADEYIVIAPLWAGGLAPASRTFLKTIPIDKVHLVVTSIGNHVKDRSGYKSVHDITKITGNEDLVIDDLVNSLPNSKAK